MNLTSNQVKNLLKVLQVTREKEINCNECLEHVSEFAELELQGKAIPKALEAVTHHLSICSECREEYESLQEALKVIEGEGEVE